MVSVRITNFENATESARKAARIPYTFKFSVYFESEYSFRLA